MFHNLTITHSSIHPATYTNEEIIYLTGIIGVHPDLTKQDNISIEINPFPDATIVILKSAAIERLEIMIYNRFNYIENLCLRGTQQKSGIASKWVASQAAAASSRGFKHLEATAYKDSSGSTTVWSGYIVWGKLGYLLYDTSIKDFENLMKNKGRTEKTIIELISTQEGLNFWIAEGFSWQAIFDLTKDSESFNILNEYLERKNRLS
jgi:hypothetical protein